MRVSKPQSPLPFFADRRRRRAMRRTAAIRAIALQAPSAGGSVRFLGGASKRNRDWLVNIIPIHYGLWYAHNKLVTVMGFTIQLTTEGPRCSLLGLYLASNREVYYNTQQHISVWYLSCFFHSGCHVYQEKPARMAWIILGKFLHTCIYIYIYITYQCKCMFKMVSQLFLWNMGSVWQELVIDMILTHLDGDHQVMSSIVFTP